MNQKNLLIASVTMNVALIIIIFLVKGNAKEQAEAHVNKVLETNRYQVAQVNDNIQNNNLLWTLIDSTWKSSDKSKVFVKKLADSQRVPRCNGKNCAGTEDEARLRTVISNNAQDQSIRVGWGSRGKESIKYSFKVIYDQKGKFATIDASDLLGKTSNDNSGAEDEEPAEEAAE
ncbi:MAG: hypothetical protein LBQ87_00215 [Candidatus Fibromonas sp.]|jgi:hypothetical protein|nr:hypothetical protein [Candidatus Fibromonas sp.]